MWLIADAAGMQMQAWLILLLPIAGMVLGLVAGWFYQRLLFGPLPGRWRSAIAGGVGPLADRLGEGLGRALPPRELFRLMEPEKVAATVTRTVLARLDQHVDEVMRERYAVLWDNLPHSARHRVYARVARQLPSLLDNLVEDLAEQLDQLTDFQALLRDMVLAQPERLAELLAAALRQERAFLMRTGALVGLLLGGAQALVWQGWPQAWLQLPLAGALALAAVLLPRAWLYRAGRPAWRDSATGEELARAFSQRLAGEMFNARRLLQTVVTGASAARTRSIIRRHLRPLLETGMTRTTLQLLLGAEGYVHIKQSVMDRVTTLTLGALEAGPLDARQGDRIEAACRQRLLALPPGEVRAILRPALDEGLWWRLLAVAGLGALAGLVEVLLLRAGG